jgi:hypothetical protein
MSMMSGYLRILVVAIVSTSFCLTHIRDSCFERLFTCFDGYCNLFSVCATSSLTSLVKRSLAIKAASFSSLFVSSARPTAQLRL